MASSRITSWSVGGGIAWKQRAPLSEGFFAAHGIDRKTYGGRYETVETKADGKKLFVIRLRAQRHAERKAA